jgi:hypothetical protein
MRRWQRKIATLLLLVFVPANIAYALPLVYCLGTDGHRAIELAQGVGSHCVERGQLHATDLSVEGHDASAENSGDHCVDAKLVTPGQHVQRTADGKAGAVPLAGTPPNLLSVSPETLAHEPSQHRNCSASNGRCLANDQLAALKTVFLLN